MATTIPACDGRVLAAGPHLPRSRPEPRRGRRGARGGDGRRRRSSPTATPTTARSCCASRPGPATSIVGRDGTVFVNDVKFDDIATDAVPAGRASRTSSTSCSATTARRRSTAARSARCSGTRSSRRSSPSSGRFATSRSASVRARARRPADRLRLPRLERSSLRPESLGDVQSRESRPVIRRRPTSARRSSRTAGRRPTPSSRWRSRRASPRR